MSKVLILLSLAAGAALSAGRPERYAVVLADPPVAAQTKSVAEWKATASASRAQVLAAKQSAIKAAIGQRGMIVYHSDVYLVNAIFVQGTAEQAREIAKIPGVKYVAPDVPLKRKLNRALDLIKAKDAWASSQIGGQQNAGAGIRIAILDTGIDQNHPAFKDASLSMPSGFPKGDTAYTNTKVIAARSYVDKLVYFGSDNPADWRGDDLSARDRVGHGTAAAMVAAGNTVAGPAGTITGVAPKAYLGNYKIFGSPGVNDTTYFAAVDAALVDALNDGMDIASLSVGASALWAANDSGATCGNANGVYCDLLVDAVENAVHNGLTVVAAAGNDGDLGTANALASMNTPGTAPSAISVGASTNSHIWYQTVKTGRGDAYNALFGNGPRPGGPLSGPLKDVGRLGDDGFLCSPISRGALNGSIALIARGNCALDSKVYNAQNAGAIGVILYQGTSNGQPVDYIYSIQSLGLTGIPAVLVGNTNGKALKSYAADNNATATLDPAYRETNATADEMAVFSSQGPSIGDASIKPEVVAVGTDLYVATQTFDPNGDLYDPTGYTVVNGTSFAAPMAAGAAALVLQANPRFVPVDIKSALVTTANQQLTDFPSGTPVQASVNAMGGGKIDASQAIKANVTFYPPVASFGAITTMQVGNQIGICNWTGNGIKLDFTVQPRGSDPGRVTVNPSSYTIPPNQCQDKAVNITFGNVQVPAAGSYEGVVNVSGGSVPMRIPYLYVVPSASANRSPYNLLPLRGFDFVRDQNAPITMTLKVTDQWGVGIPGVKVQFSAEKGGGRIDTALSQTDALGITEAKGFVGSQLGEASFLATVVNNSNMLYRFSGRVRPLTSINTNGVVNGASFEVGQGVAPGSFVSIFGRGLSDASQQAYTKPLPLSLVGVAVSFDSPTKKLSYPASMLYVSDGQVNVQVPWELAGETSATMKVAIAESASSLYTVPINAYSPAAFEKIDSTGRQIVAAQNENYGEISTDNPARKGRVVILYANGLGPVNNQPGTGQESPGGGSLATVKNPPQVTIGGRAATVQFAGLSPGFVALYQINAVVPPDVASGAQPVVITSNGVSSKPANLPIQ